MIQYRKIRSVRLSKMKMNIVIFISAVDLFPNACFYLLLLIFTIIAVLGAFVGDAKMLLLILGATAAPINAFSALQLLRLNTTLLPLELRPPLWRKLALILCALFYGAVSIAMFRQVFSL